MVKSIRYYIGGVEYSAAELVKCAIDFGWKGEDKRISDVKEMTQQAIDFLLTKNLSVKSVLIGSFESMRRDTIPPPEIRMIPRLSPPPIETIIDNSIMRAYFESGIYSIDTKLLGNECWDLQIFGVAICSQCSYRNKPTCFGEVSLSGMNSLGHVIPVAKLIGDRPKRENGKEEAPDVA